MRQKAKLSRGHLAALRRLTIWTTEADPDSPLPRGWHWGEPWHEPSPVSRRHARGRWAVRNRDGRQVRVVFERWRLGDRVKLDSLELVLLVEDAARGNPTGYAEAMEAIEAQQLRGLRDLDYRLELEELNRKAREALQPPGVDDGGQPPQPFDA